MVKMFRCEKVNYMSCARTTTADSSDEMSEVDIWEEPYISSPEAVEPRMEGGGAAAQGGSQAGSGLFMLMFRCLPGFGN